MNIRHRKQTTALELRAQESKVIKELKSADDDLDLRLESLKKKGLKLASSICLELKDYK